MPRYIPKSVWITEKVKGYQEYEVTKKDGTVVKYNCYTIPNCVWDSIVENRCPVYYGPEREEIRVLEEE